MTLPEMVLDLRVQIEQLLPGWKVWARLDTPDFQFFGWKGSIKDCVLSSSYNIKRIPSADEIAQEMQMLLEHMSHLRENG